MAIFRGYVAATLRRNQGYDGYGEPTPGSAEPLRIAVGKLRPGAMPSAVRADSSASHARIEQHEAPGVLLLPPTSKPSVGDILETLGQFLRIVSVLPQYDLMGRLSHYEVNVEAAAISAGDNDFGVLGSTFILGESETL